MTKFYRSGHAPVSVTRHIPKHSPVQNSLVIPTPERSHFNTPCHSDAGAKRRRRNLLFQPPPAPWPPLHHESALPFGLNANSMVTEVPDYPTPPLEQVDEEYANELRRQEQRAKSGHAREDYMAEYHAQQNQAASQNPSTPTCAGTHAFVRPPNIGTPTPVSPTNVGRAAPGCPGGPELPGPQRTATEASPSGSCRSRSPKAATRCERSSRSKATGRSSPGRTSEGAKEHSP